MCVFKYSHVVLDSWMKQSWVLLCLFVSLRMLVMTHWNMNANYHSFSYFPTAFHICTTNCLIYPFCAGWLGPTRTGGGLGDLLMVRMRWGGWCLGHSGVTVWRHRNQHQVTSQFEGWSVEWPVIFNSWLIIVQNWHCFSAGIWHSNRFSVGDNGVILPTMGGFHWMGGGVVAWLVWWDC